MPEEILQPGPSAGCTRQRADRARDYLKPAMSFDFGHSKPLAEGELALYGFRPVRPTELTGKVRIVSATEETERCGSGSENNNICSSHLVAMSDQISHFVFDHGSLGDNGSLPLSGLIIPNPDLKR
jgi:hypothetical protein